MQNGSGNIKNILIRTASPDDAARLLEIYSYYVEKTAVSFEWKVPSLSEFTKRISCTLQKYPYFLAETSENGRNKILGYAYASPFKTRAAYEWAAETSIYVDKDFRQCGVGKRLLETLEQTLQKQNILNVNACIAYTENENQYLTNGSFCFHQKMRYQFVGKFHKCGYKFGTWFDMVWMEKIIGEHTGSQKPIIPFSKLIFT